MRIAIVAAGGVGGFLGARLIAAGVEVALLARGAHLAAIRTHGLSLETPSGTTTVRPATITDNPADIGEVDIVIFAVKLPDGETAAAACRPLIGPETGVVPFLNGVEATPLLAKTLGPQHAMMGCCYIFAEVAGPGRIRQTGSGARFLFGEADGGQSQRSNALRAALVSAGLDAPLPGDMRVEVWRKFAFLATISGFTAAARAPIGALRSAPRTRALMRRAIEEAVAVAAACGVGLPGDTVERHMTFLDSLPPESRASQANDLAAGRPLELEWLSGAVARLGLENGVATPVHETLTAVLLPHAKGAPKV
ncbi:MAG: 2-dehydropantoate 2-reductase [Bauldia sp.]